MFPILSEIYYPVLSTATPQSREITTLIMEVFLVCAAIFLVVAVWVGYSIVKFRHRGEEGEPDQHQIHKAYEITWTIIPTFICVLLGWWTVVSMMGPRSGEAIRDSDPDLVIRGAQWWWEISYPKLGIVTANEIHIPVGRPLVIELESNDVIHTFWVPDLGRKQQMIPGHRILLTIQADVPDKYLGACAQYCGNQHAWMRLLLFSQSEADFNAWAAQQKKANPVPGPLLTAAAISQSTAPAAALLSAAAVSEKGGGNGSGGNNGSGGDIARGFRIYQEQTCGTCHAIEGVSAVRYAPDLSHIASRETLGAGVLVNNRENLYKWLLDPQAIKPGCNMPNFHLSPDQTSDLVAYLETLQ